ncbi:50S ribosomal protein L35 [Cokeromyces recurvatus]|uniref:50S ribosomal protein L35 n=1 Tax=Cokeromyces recurvatus TaxID=90255 RepID=UPI00221F402E|nr:50S ribosomal protein L35 [Cokeromyces recurvatus]KAI7906886.1 50S ribosomal protein L35 [Cokeromyces recurvatus]
MAYKLKSHSGAKKRFFPTGTNNYKRWQAGIRHLNSGFSAERVNRLSKTVFVNTTQKKMLKKALPYSM